MATAFAPGSTRRSRVRASFSPSEWRRLYGMFGFIALLHVVGLTLLILASMHHYSIGTKSAFGVGTGVLAYSLGMRHAFDADHIAAIDNTTRKFMAEGKRPMSVGFFFSLGHSTIVVCLTVLLGLGARALGSQVRNNNSPLHHYGTLFGTIVSGSFLYLIATLNLIILWGIVRLFIQMRQGRFDDSELEKHLNSRGFMMRFFGPLARSIDEPWKMYPLGVLFGLGFDTASEVAFLVLTGTVVAGGLPFWALLSLPILFAAGMSLLDTIDGSFMNFAYGWAFSKPVRKVYYNITITGLSVFVAFYIGTLELLQVVTDQLGIDSGPLAALGKLNLNYVGYAIVALFVLTWVVALSVWKYGRIEEKWSAGIRSERVIEPAG